MATAHFDALSSKHHLLDDEIAHEMQRPMPDSIHLAHLKKEKLRLKEEMQRLH